MLIALIGPPCAGKQEVARYLIQSHAFRPAYISSSPSTSAASSALTPELQGGTNGIESSKADPGLDDRPTLFNAPSALLEHATAHWREPIVTCDLRTRADVEPFEKRPFFLLVFVEAPTTVRWKRAVARSSEGSLAPSLEDFILEDDRILHGYSADSSFPEADTHDDLGVSFAPLALNGGSIALADGAQAVASATQAVRANGTIASFTSSIAVPGGKGAALSALQQHAHVRVSNPYNTLAPLWSTLFDLSLPSGHRLRPSWDTYFLSLCTLASLRSNCMKRRVGAVLVRANRVLSTGYNGTPRGLKNCAEGGCARCNASAACGSALEECLCLHAEENALLELGRDRGGAEGTVLYCNTCPCLRCAVKIVQTGVREVVYHLAYSMDDRSAQIFQEANVIFRQYVRPV